MPEEEDRLAAILRWILIMRSLATRKYSESNSTPIYLRPVSNAEAQVDAEPQNASSVALPVMWPQMLIGPLFLAAPVSCAT